jgi:hypothetical protein
MIYFVSHAPYPAIFAGSRVGVVLLELWMLVFVLVPFFCLLLPLYLPELMTRPCCYCPVAEVLLLYDVKHHKKFESTIMLAINAQFWPKILIMTSLAHFITYFGILISHADNLSFSIDALVVARVPGCASLRWWAGYFVSGPDYPPLEKWLRTRPPSPRWRPDILYLGQIIPPPP